LLRRLQTRESGVPGPEKRLSAEAKAFRNPPQATATPQVARSEEWSIRDSKPPRGRTGEECHTYARFETTAWPYGL
jgi:hypothetical protein